MKRPLVNTLILVFVLMCSPLPGFTQGTGEMGHWQTRSLDMAVTDRGFGAGATWRYGWNKVWSSPLQFSLLFFQESDKIPVCDYYGRCYRPESKKIMFLNTRTGIQHRLWANAIAENTQPFLFASLGPSLAINPRNQGPFLERWKETTFDATVHLFVGAGVDFVYSRMNLFTVTIGYEYIRFFRQVDGTNNYSGLSVVLSFGERL